MYAFLRNQTREKSMKVFYFVVAVLIFSAGFETASAIHEHDNLKSNGSSLAGIEFPEYLSFNALSSTSAGCSFSNSKKIMHSEAALTSQEDSEDDVDAFVAAMPQRQSVKLHLKHRSTKMEPGNSVLGYTVRDSTRIKTLYRRVIEKKNQNTLSRLQRQKEMPKEKYNPVVAPASSPESSPAGFSSQLHSGVSLGSGEYFMDVFVGTPPKLYSLILDTGSDLNWIQCIPCYACFEQTGPFYNPKDSSSYRNISCHDQRCQLVSSPDPPKPCRTEDQACPYFYWYGDSSNTTGDFALESFTVNLTKSNGKLEFRRVENVMFGCGHWNRGLFHGAAGLLGLGRGPLSFASQLQSLYGHSFSYCLVDRNSDANITSKLIFGEDKELLRHPNLNFTSLIGGKENPGDTFYYVQIKSIVIDGEVLNIPDETWHLSPQGAGGTIIDSGTTLTYFADPAYQIIKDTFVKRIQGYPIVDTFPPLKPCYNVSGVKTLELPEFGIRFADGSVWNFPVENYFIQIEPDSVLCLAILGTNASALSIIGNYQQQNFHILYDTKNSRFGFAPMKCADV